MRELQANFIHLKQALHKGITKNKEKSDKAILSDKK
jgi:hypothetical protein